MDHPHAQIHQNPRYFILHFHYPPHLTPIDFSIFCDHQIIAKYQKHLGQKPAEFWLIFVVIFRVILWGILSGALGWGKQKLVVIGDAYIKDGWADA